MNQLGIVVIGRNEGQRLVDCLNSLKAHEGRVVYVDSGSIDGSISVAERARALVVRLDAVRPFTAARARNEGFAALVATMPHVGFVQFIDGDCVLVPDWLEIALPFIANRTDVAVVCGRRRERYPERSIYNRLCDIEWNTPIGEAVACGGDSLVRVDAFQEVSGFRPDLMAGEEPELCARLRAKGWKIWRLDAEMTRHDAAIIRFSQWWLRAVRSGYAAMEVSLAHLSTGEMLQEKRTVASAATWAGLLPLVILFSSLFHPVFLALILIYVIQLARIAVRGRTPGLSSWTYAAFMMIAKFAELQGIVRYLWHFCRGEAGRLIEYKRNG
jgi:glycosyltransferase involved in cell wall biosynthesis